MLYSGNIHKKLVFSLTLSDYIMGARFPVDYNNNIFSRNQWSHFSGPTIIYNKTL